MRPARSHGLRVIEAATLAAGPMAGTALGEFGAEVIKVEQPGAGDPMRTWGERKDGIALVWKSVSRNKRCVTLDLRQPDGQELFHQLLAVSDVLIVGNRPSALERWGIDYDIGARPPSARRHGPHQRLRRAADRRATAPATARWPRR